MGGVAVRGMELGEERRGEVEEALRRRDLTPRVRERLEMVKAVGLGYDVSRIEEWSGREARTIRRWVRAYLRRGLAGLADAPRSGRPAEADAAYLAALERAADTPPRDLGLPFDAWTSARLSAYLAETTKVRVTPGWLRHLLARRRFACGRPKHTLQHLQDPDDVARCERELAAAEKKWASNRPSTSSITRTRPTGRRIRCSIGSGTGSGSSPGSRRPGPIGG
jgi:transposase